MEMPVTRDAPAVVVTGVSTGIGRGTLHELIGAGYRVFGSVRTAAVAKAAEEVRRALGTGTLSVAESFR